MSDLTTLPGMEPPTALVPAARTPRPRTPRTPVNLTETSTRKRIGGDHPFLFNSAIVGLVGVIVAALTISASALVVVGGWQQTPDLIDPLTIAMIDLPMLVAFVCSIIFKHLEYGVWLGLSRTFGWVMTAFSAGVNFLYTVSASALVNETTGLSTYQEITGAIVHAAAPVLVNVCFEFVGQIIVRPKRKLARLRKMAVRDLKRTVAELERREKALRKIEGAEVRG